MLAQRTIRYKHPNKQLQMQHLTPTYNSMISANNGANLLYVCVLGGGTQTAQ